MLRKKIEKEWTLPKPDKGKRTQWLPVVRLGRFIPFGYRQDEDDPDILQPIPSELELLEDAKKHLKRYSYREVAGWLSQESGRYISHVGLVKRIKIERKRRQQAAIQRLYEEKAKEAARKAERLERKIGGPGSRTDYDEADDDPGTG